MPALPAARWGGRQAGAGYCGSRRTAVGARSARHGTDEPAPGGLPLLAASARYDCDVPGVIALLDPDATRRVEALWSEMHGRFGVRPGFPGAVPHVTFHISSHDVEPRAATAVEGVARTTPPFTLNCSGLGVFTGAEPILFLVVARSSAAASLAERLEQALRAAGCGPTDPYYTPDRWIPHITIAQQNLAGADLPGLLAWLSGQPLAMELPITAISIARETPTGADILATFPLGAAT